MNTYCSTNNLHGKHFNSCNYSDSDTENNGNKHDIKGIVINNSNKDSSPPKRDGSAA